MSRPARHRPVGRCWACGGPVDRASARWLADPVVLRDGRPVRRLVHARACYDRALRMLGGRR